MDRLMHATLTELMPSLHGAQRTGDASFSGVSTDSRSAQAGSLFVALHGESFDAHDFLGQVAASGVAAMVVERLPAGWDSAKVPAIVVPDTLVALGRIAHYWRSRFSLPSSASPAATARPPSRR